MMRLFARRQDARRFVRVPHRIGPHRRRSPTRRDGGRGPKANCSGSVCSWPRALGTADATASTDVAERVAQALQPYFDQHQFPGISVAVVTDGKVALEQGYGTSNVATGSPVEANTRFDIGSVTKTFTALGVLLLYQESQGTSRPLNLDAPISEYLHNTRSFKLPRKWSGITTRELLDMTSGINNVGSTEPWPAQIASIAKERLLFTPGTESYYSNTNYYLLGELIQQWTGENYGAFIQNRILAPLGMSQTEELGKSPTVRDQAVGYGPANHGKWPKAAVHNGPSMYAAAGMVSTAQDMATYMIALMNGDLLSPATYALMWTSTPTPQYDDVDPSSDADRGPGWDTVIDASTGPVEVEKGGQVPGFTSELVLFPNTDSGVFVSFNANYTSSRNPNGVTGLEVARSVFKAAKTTS